MPKKVELKIHLKEPNSPYDGEAICNSFHLKPEKVMEDESAVTCKRCLWVMKSRGKKSDP